MFAYTAKQQGTVISKTANGIIVEYKDGSKKGVNLGRIFGKSEGSVYPHDIISKLEIGDKFNKGDAIAYNSGFFEQDILDPKKIVIKNAMVVKTALFESNQTFEDSSSISKKVSGMLSAKTTKIKSITIGFNQNIHNVVEVGKEVKHNDTLMIIEDEITSNKSFDEESLATLKKLSNQSPTSKYNGVIDKIEVYYHGNKEDMSNGLKLLADKSDKQLAAFNKANNLPVITGQVNDEYRVSGVPLSLDKAEIRIYITINTSAGIADKGVFANQLKSIFGEVMDYKMTTESGDEIDALFGYRSIAARITLSPELIGTTTTLLKVIGKEAVKIYRG